MNSWKQNIYQTQQQLILSDISSMRTGISLQGYTPIEYGDVQRQLFNSTSIANENLRNDLTRFVGTKTQLEHAENPFSIVSNSGQHLIDNDALRNQISGNEFKYQPSSTIPSTYGMKTPIELSSSLYNKDAISNVTAKPHFPLNQCFATPNYLYHQTPLQQQQQQLLLQKHAQYVLPTYEINSNRPTAIDNTSNNVPMTERVTLNPTNAMENNTINRNLVNHSNEPLSSTLSKTNYLASILPLHKLPENETQISPYRQQSNADKSAFNFNDSHTYSSIKNSNQPQINYENQRAQFLFTDEASMLSTNPQTISTSVTKTNLTSEIFESVPNDIGDSNAAAQIHHGHRVQHLEQQQQQKRPSSMKSFDTDKTYKTDGTTHNNNCVNELTQRQRENEKIEGEDQESNSYHGSENKNNHTQNDNGDEQWRKKSDNDGYVDTKQLADRKISEMRPDYDFIKIDNGYSTANVNNFTIASPTPNMNDAKVDMATAAEKYNFQQIPQKFTRHDETSKKDNYRYDDDVDIYTSGNDNAVNQHPNDSIKTSIKGAHNRLHITNDKAPNVLIKTEEKRRMSIDSSTLAKESDTVNENNNNNYDSYGNLQKKSFVANEHRRYSVAALNNLPQNFANVEPFQLASLANNSNDTTNNIFQAEINRNKYDNDHLNMFIGPDTNNRRAIEQRTNEQNTSAVPAPPAIAKPFESNETFGRTFENQENFIFNNPIVSTGASYLPTETTNNTNFTTTAYFGDAEQSENTTIANDFADKSHLRYENNESSQLNGTNSSEPPTTMSLETRLEHLQLTDDTDTMQLNQSNNYDPQVKQQENIRIEQSSSSSHG